MAAAAEESAATKASTVYGIWLGTLVVGAQSLRIQVALTGDSEGQAQHVE